MGRQKEESECQLNCEEPVIEAERDLSRVKRDFPGSSVAKTLSSRCRAWSGELDPTRCNNEFAWLN